MTEVTIRYPDESWGQEESDHDYKPIEYKAALVNVIRLDGKWIGIISDERGIRKIAMSKVVEWDEHNADYSPSWW